MSFFKEKWYENQINKLRQTMYILALSILKNEADVEDAIQNTLIISYEHLDELRMKDKFKPWILQILKRECYRIQKKKMYTIDDDSMIEDNHQNHDIDKMTLWQYISILDEKYREVIILFYFESMSIKDIAQTLQIEESNVKKRLSRARLNLKQKLEEGAFYE